MNYTNLRHLESADQRQEFIARHENVMISCGRTGPVCIPVHGVMGTIEPEYPHIYFADMEFPINELNMLNTNYHGILF